MNTTLSIIAISVVLAGNIVVWVYTLWRTGKNEANKAGKYEERLNGLVKDVDALPCKSNPEFQLDMGAMIQKYNDIDYRLGRIEKKLDIYDGG